MLLFLLAAPAQAELVGEFNARLKDVKRSYGAYTVVMDARVYDTTGAPTPPACRRQRCTSRAGRGCGTGSSRSGSSAIPRRSSCGPTRCSAVPATSPPVESCSTRDRTSWSRSRPTCTCSSVSGREGALASVVALVIPNELTPAYAYQVLEGRLYNSSAAGPRFGYRLELPTEVKPLIPGLVLRLAEIHLTIDGLEIRRRGRDPLFWTKVPKCPSSRKVSFGADYAFEGGQSISRRRRVSCRRFIRRPTRAARGRDPRRARLGRLPGRCVSTDHSMKFPPRPPAAPSRSAPSTGSTAATGG